MPSGLIEHVDDMGTGFNDAGDLFEMGVQRFRVGIGHNEQLCPCRGRWPRRYKPTSVRREDQEEGI